MDILSKKHDNYQRKKFWSWITVLAVFFSLISSGFLLYQWWKTKQTAAKIQEREQTLAQLEQAEQQKAFQEYQIQQKQLSQVSTLAKNPAIHQFFNDLLQGYAYQFAEKENLTAYCLPLKFGGFYQKTPQVGQQQGEMGNCLYQQDQQQIIISLNQIYLLNKLGHEKYLANPEHYLAIDFTTLTETLAHELAHYFQFIKYEKSSCESSGQKDASGNFLYPGLVSEHAEFTTEIKQMIINSNEYSALEKYWKAIDVRS